MPPFPARFGNRFTALVFALALGLMSPVVLGALPSHTGDGQPLPSLAPMLKEVNPAVVNIATYSTARQAYNPLLNDPFFRHFFDIPDRRAKPQKRQQSAGSGVIVDAGKGIVLTNFHVVRDADEVVVSLLDGRDHRAEVLGTDPELDIAVLKIEGDGLAEVPLANSNQLQVGDFVVAIGNPFGLGQTVTTGVVSALDRTGLGIEGFENFIQTDASINPGNSGGALVNLRGELVGINTAIISPAGGNVGIGFAIPINMARASMEQILEHGEVRRGELGVSVQAITPDLRQAFGLSQNQRGVLVTGVDSGSAAEEAGVRAGDVVVAVNGDMTRSESQFRSQVGTVPVGDELTLDILRKGKARELTVEVREPQLAANADQLHPLLAGVRFENGPNGQSVLVSAMSPRSYAAYAGLRPGDAIIGANEIRVRNLREFAKALGRSQRQVVLTIARGNRQFTVVIR